MAVPGGDDARSTLRALLHGTPGASWRRRPALPDGVVAGDDGAPLPDPPPHGYLADATYALGGPARLDPAQLDTAQLDTAQLDPAQLDLSPAEAIATLTPDELAAYRGTSVDLTMRGGTTSGVVYPLAVCEIARAARVRSVGGASAGAVAAAATAAAELGRSRLAAGLVVPDEVAPGHVRPGYAGLAGTLAWLAEVDEPDDGPERHRLAALFQPAAQSRPLWRVVQAVLQGRTGLAAARTLVAFGWAWTVGIVVAVLVAVATTAGLLTGSATLPRAGAVLTGLGLLTVGGVAVGLAVRAGGVHRRTQREVRARTPAQQALLDVTSAAPAPRPGLPRLAASSALVGVALLVLAGPRALLAGVPVALALAVVVVALLAVPALRVLGDVRARGYGLLGGASTTPGAPRPLVTWLDETLSELAGQPGRSLTFGDLWWGDGACDPAATTDPQRRRVNLELVCSDLTAQRALRFPLTADPLHVQHDDLVPLVGPDLAARLCPAATAVPTRTADGTPLVLHPLPAPGEVPVVLAVRTSLAVPGLFTAVRVYRLRPPAPVRDDLGAGLGSTTGPLTWPPFTEAVPAWLSDGGITSNFPVELFDTLLPQWPTLGLEHGPHPEGFEHQDVWLPRDWEAPLPPSRPVGASALGLLGAVLDTARSWRDRANTASPATRGRVAWVREHPGEGGANLDAGRDVVASLGLRGALAGARLRQRYRTGGAGPSPSWSRDRWLRLRVAVAALEAQRARTAPTVAAYVPLLDPTAAAEAADAPVPAVARPSYLPGDPDFFPAAAALLARTGVDEAVPDATADTPRPAPGLVLSTRD